MSLTPVEEAKARLAAEPPAHALARREVRELFLAARQLAQEAATPESAQSARRALHLEGLRLAHSLVSPSPAAAHPSGLAELEALHAAEVEELDADENLVAHFQRRRVVAVGLGLIALALMALVAGVAIKSWAEPVDLAKGKPFTLSSEWAPCHPEAGECGGYPTRIAFHTKEESNPWYRVDLGAPTDFSKLTIVNRGDMALMRAVPLVIEVSDDGEKFRELARQTQRFETWTPEVGAQKGRYVRLRVDRTSVLHLEAVKIHP